MTLRVKIVPRRASTTQREIGFQETSAKEFPEIETVAN